MNQQTKHGELAARIRAAYAGTPIAPIRPQLAELDVDAAYAIQQDNTAHWQAEGRRLVGSKIGLTSRAVQRQLGVDRPDFGVLFADMIVAEDEPVAAGRVLQPKIEAEVAFLLGFADASAFTRAFRRWTGSTPGAWRAQQRAAGPPSQAG